MKFNEVEKSLKEGKKIKLASWKNAYWYYDQENGVIMNHFEEDGSPDVPTSALFPRDILWVMGNDWEVVGEETAAVPKGGCSKYEGTSSVFQTYYDHDYIDRVGREIVKNRGNKLVSFQTNKMLSGTNDPRKLIIKVKTTNLASLLVANYFQFARSPEEAWRMYNSITGVLSEIMRDLNVFYTNKMEDENNG